MHHARKIL